MPPRLSKWSWWSWHLPGCPNGLSMALGCLPGKQNQIWPWQISGAIPGSSSAAGPLETPGLSKGSPRAPGSLEPPRLSIQVSGPCWAVHMLPCSLPDCPNGSLEPPGLFKWFHGASRVVQRAPTTRVPVDNVTLEPRVYPPLSKFQWSRRGRAVASLIFQLFGPPLWPSFR